MMLNTYLLERIALGEVRGERTGQTVAFLVRVCHQIMDERAFHTSFVLAKQDRDIDWMLPTLIDVAQGLGIHLASYGSRGSAVFDYAGRRHRIHITTEKGSMLALAYGGVVLWEEEAILKGEPEAYPMPTIRWF